MNTKSITYFTAVGWFLLSLLSSLLNDTISKYLGARLHVFEISFFRFFFSTISLVPFVLYEGAESMRSSNLTVHLVRGMILFFGITAWTYGLTVAPITTATVISFTIPMFVLILAKFFLNEKVIWQRWVATLLGFIGIIIVLNTDEKILISKSFIFVLAAVGFASLDIINKKFVTKETMISMLFYSTLVTAILSIAPAMYHWQMPTSYELALLFILGVSANLILYFILKAFKLLDATAVAPYRYLELIMAALVGYVLFGEALTRNILYGALVIIPTTLFIVYSENKLLINDTEQ